MALRTDVRDYCNAARWLLQTEEEEEGKNKVEDCEKEAHSGEGIEVFRKQVCIVNCF